MSYNFQPPVFNATQPVTGLYVTGVPVQVNFLFHSSRNHFRTAQDASQPKLQIKVIFYGHSRPGFLPGFWSCETSVLFENAPDRQTLLSILTNWASQVGLATPIYAGQATMYIAESAEAGLTITPVVGVLPPTNLQKTIPLTANPPPPIFRRDIENIRTGRHAAFLVVNMDTRGTYISPE